MVEAYALREGLSKRERFCLKSAALLHDMIFVPGKKDNESRTSAYAGALLNALGYNSDDIATIKSLIVVTDISIKKDIDAMTVSEKIMCDADLDYLGRDDFLKMVQGIIFRS